MRKRTITPKKADQYHHGDLRRALLQAALTLAESEGPRGVTLRAAARLAGVSQTAPYRHFADRDALLAAVAEEAVRELTAAMRTAKATCDQRPLLELQALGVTYVRFAAAHPSYFRVMFGAGLTTNRSQYPELVAATNECFTLLFDAIRACQKAGLARAGDPLPLALSAWSLVHGAASLQVDGFVGIAGRTMDAEELGTMVTRELMRGLGAGPGRAPTTR